MREDVEDGNSLKRESNITPKLEVVNPECRAISRPRVICDIPTNVVSPSWSEYGSAMLETWGVLEKAASFIDHSIHDASNDGTNDDFAKKGPNNDDFEDAKESGVFDSVLAHDSMYGTHRHREAESTSLSSPPREKFLNIDQGGGPTSPDYCPPGDVSCEDHTYSEIAPSTDLTSDHTQVVGPLSIEIKRDDGTIDPSKPKSAFDREEVNIDNLESGTTRYIAMDDAATASSLIQCSAPLTQGASPISPPMIAMAFGCAVVLLHIIWVASSKF
ncbi:hypothetical protein ACHAXA_003683 [Cyclostephanos tholiformis]|uniref:Uncharacterized protein n=1 Tax=Cyclostephanos tholiformis TaxID=382380 RepID=A0ABD3SP35_9STRA